MKHKTLITDLIYEIIGSILIAAAVHNFALKVDKIFYGINSEKLAFIVTRHGKEVCSIIEECSNRGSTILKSRGGYRLEEKETVTVVSNSKQMYRILQAVTAYDTDAFIILPEAHEIHGKGFSVL